MAKRSYGWPEDARFLVPDGVREHFRSGFGQRGSELRAAWEVLMEEYRAKHPDLADQLDRMQERKPPDHWNADLPSFSADSTNQFISIFLP